MLESTRLSEQKAAVSKKLRSDRFAVMTGQEDDFAQRQGEIRAMYDQTDDLETRIVAALDQEDQEAQAAMARNVNTEGWTPELREFRSLAQKTSIADYVQAVVTERNVTGAAKEYNEAIFDTWHPGDYPLEMLLDRDEFYDFDAAQMRDVRDANIEDEKRTVITGIVKSAGNISFADRLLASGEGAYLRASFPAVGPGRHSYPIVSGTTIAATIARGTAETPAGGLSIKNADPDRIQHSYEYAAADELQMPGVANNLASDLRMSLASGLDRKVVVAMTAALDGGQVVIASTVTAASLIGGVHGVVDGRTARYFNEVRLLAGNTTVSGQTTAFQRVGALLSATMP